MKMTFELTGAYAGRTVVLNGHQFVNGEMTIHAEPGVIDSVSKVLGLSYQAFPKGSPELEAAQKRDAAFKEKTRGPGSEIHPAAQQHPAAEVRRDDAAPGDVQKVQPADAGKPDGQLESASGNAGVVSAGSGPQDSQLSPEVASKVRKALTLLKHDNDAHWSADGKPSVEFVVQATNDQTISRAIIDHVDPKLTRESLKEAAGIVADL